MKTWTPLVVTIILALALNVFPFFMAFVVRAEGWDQAGWALYFFTIPIGGALILLGLVISLVIFFRRKKT